MRAPRDYAAWVLMRVCVALAIMAFLVVALSGCTSVTGTVYRVHWFESGTCYVYAKGEVDGVMHYKAIKVGRDMRRADCYRRNEVGDRIRFSVSDASRADQ